MMLTFDWRLQIAPVGVLPKRLALRAADAVTTLRYASVARRARWPLRHEKKLPIDTS